MQIEISKTRRLFEALPNGYSDFKPYENSMTLGRLVGHITDLFQIIALTAELDMAVSWQPYTMCSKAELIVRFEENATRAFAAFKQISDEALHQSWTIKRGPNELFSGERHVWPISRWYLGEPDQSRTGCFPHHPLPKSLRYFRVLAFPGQ